MDLVINLLRLRPLLNEIHHDLEFLLTPRLKSSRIMEDKPWIALEDECTTNVVDPALHRRNQSSHLIVVQKSPSRHLRGRFELLVKKR